MRRFCWAFTLTLGVVTGTSLQPLRSRPLPLRVARTTARRPIRRSRLNSPPIYRRIPTPAAPIPAMSRAPLPWPKMPGRSATGAARMVRAPTAKPWLRSWARRQAVQVHRQPQPHLPQRLPRRNQPLARWARPRVARVVPSPAPAELRHSVMRLPTPGLRTTMALRNVPFTPGVSVSSRRRTYRLLRRMVCIGGNRLGSPSD